jgi:Ca-activated chloride channel family protein
LTTFSQLAAPWWLLGLTVVPLLIWFHHRPDRLPALTFSRLPTAAKGSWRLHLPFYVRLAAFACLIVALARPQLGYAWEESLTEGIDIEIVLDISGSMGAEDFQPSNRLTVAKAVMQDFIARRSADRLGLVVFSGTALTRSPLTTDREMLSFLVDSLELNTLPDGTAIGVALANAATRLKDSGAESRVIILVTDGVNNAGEIDPASAAAICEGLGIRVYTIGVGTNGQVRVPVTVRDPMTGRTSIQRRFMNVEVDDELLAAIAERTDGKFFKASDPEALQQVFNEIDGLEKTPLQVKKYTRFEEAFEPWAQSALALLLLPIFGRIFRLTLEP